MTTIQIERIIVVVVAVVHLDASDLQSVAGQIVLHPTAGVAQGDVAHGYVLTLDEAQQMWTSDAFIVP